MSTRRRHRCRYCGTHLNAWLQWAKAPNRVSGRTETKTYGSAEDMLFFQILTGRKSFGEGRGSQATALYDVAQGYIDDPHVQEPKNQRLIYIPPALSF
jgi:hypothetical protein